MEDYEGLPPEIAMYIKRIGDMREVRKFGRAVQLCDKALVHEPQPPILNVILNFKGDSLYMVAWKVQSEDIMLDARRCFLEVLDIDPADHVARRGIDVIDFIQWPEQPAEAKFVDPEEYAAAQAAEVEELDEFAEEPEPESTEEVEYVEEPVAEVTEVTEYSEEVEYADPEEFSEETEIEEPDEFSEESEEPEEDTEESEYRE